MDKYVRRIQKYFKKHQEFSDVVHTIGGIGFGILLARPFAGEHPVRWGMAFLIFALAGHWWAANH